MPLTRTILQAPGRYFINTVKQSAKKFISLFLQQLGLNLLNQEETISFLKPNLIIVHDEDHISLPDVKNCSDSAEMIFTRHEAATHKAFVWLYRSDTGKATQLPHGAVFTQSKVLCTDYNQSGFYQSLLKRSNRTSRSVKTLIAPWSHYLDGIVMGGYYDFVIQVAAKLCRIKDCMPPAAFEEAIISYPLFDTAYESEYLELLGVKRTQIEDSRYCKIVFEKAILCNSGHWYYPNSADIFLLKKYVESKLAVTKSKKDRIYISRSGRRCVQNEHELIECLKRFDFKIIEDKPRPLAEQIAIYKNASFILGPHGASFVNIIWCDAGTHLFELFSPNYIREHFVYLAQLLDMKYSAYSYKAGNRNQHHQTFLTQDMLVSVPELESCLAGIFENSETGQGAS